MVSKSEEVAGRCVRAILARLGDADSIDQSEDLDELLVALEYFLPAVLREAYPSQWQREAFDGFRLAVARKTSPTELELVGLGLLISDQTWTPLRVRLRASPQIDGISWVSCNVGDGGAAGKGMTRLPYESTKAAKLLSFVNEHSHDIDWAFSVVREAPERAV